MSFQHVWTFWKSFCFAPESPLSISIFRILFGLITLAYCCLLYPDLSNFFGDRALCSAAGSAEVLAKLGIPGLNILNVMPPGFASIEFLFWTLFAASFGLITGFFSRTSAVLVYLILAAFHQQNSMIINGGDIIMKMCAFCLMFSAAGECLSIDSLLAKKSRKAPRRQHLLPSRWPQQLFRFQIAMVYFQAFWSKVEDKNWLDGSAIYYVLRQNEFLRFPVPWISDNLWMCQSLTWGSLVIEGAIWSLIWFKETRYLVIAAALCLHTGIELTMNLPIFEWVMMASFFVFIPADDILTAFKKMREFARKIAQSDEPVSAEEAPVCAIGGCAQ